MDGENGGYIIPWADTLFSCWKNWGKWKQTTGEPRHETGSPLHEFLRLVSAGVRCTKQTLGDQQATWKQTWRGRGRRDRERCRSVLGTWELLTYVGEVLCILAQELWENGLPLEPFLVLKNVAIHEAIHHGRVGMDVDIELQACFLLGERITNEKASTAEPP